LSQILANPDLKDLTFANLSKDIKILVNEAKGLLNEEITIILITLGVNGALCLTEKGNLYGNVKVDDAVDTVGSGDAFLAGFMANYYLKKEILDCFKLAIASGAANTLIPGPGIFEKEQVDEIIKDIEIEELN